MGDERLRTHGRRRTGRGRSSAPSPGPDQPVSRQPQRRLAPTRAVSDDELEAIHLASLKILRDIGIDVLNGEARRRFARAGAEVDASGQRVRFAPEMIEELITTAPRELTLYSANPERSLRIGGDYVAFTAVASAPNVSGWGAGRRTGNHADFQKLVSLSQALHMVHLHGGYPVEPADIHPSVRHLHATYDLLTLSDKPIHAYSLGRQRNLDCLEMVRIARQIPESQLLDEPSIFTIINTSSPLRLDDPMCQGIIAYAETNQLVVITPFTLAGAMAPVTLAGAVAQQNAEALAGIALTQIVRPGAPVAYGGFTSNVDMKSGSPAFGTPEYMKAALLGGQLARRYGVPYRSSNANAANALDAQAGYESVFSLWGAVMGGANLIMHGAGWMEGGLCASYEKMVLDADLLGMVAAFLDPLSVNDADLANDAIGEVGPGGHFFGVEHTQQRYRNAFFAPMISDWRNYESWVEAGSPTAETKAARLAQQLLAHFEPPPMDGAVREELEAFVARRVEEGGVATDF